MHRLSTRYLGLLAAAAVAFATVGTMSAVRADDPGVTATTITLGSTHPYSGPASAYGAIGKAIGAYFSYLNESGGINGRKVEFKDLDDGYSPPNRCS